VEDVSRHKDYEHRLMGYNNDPATTFSDIQKVFDLLEARVAQRLKEQPPEMTAAAEAAARIPQPKSGGVTPRDLEVLEHARKLLDSPEHWDRADTQDCPDGKRAVSLFCAIRRADQEVYGTVNNDGATVHAARAWIGANAANRQKYEARLTDFNNDPAVTYADVQKLFQAIEEEFQMKIKSAGK